MKQKLFKLWIALWIAVLIWIVINNPFSWLSLMVTTMFIVFLSWWGYTQVYPQIDWEEAFDYRMAFNVILFFGTMMAFIIPCLYHLDEALKWNDWCQLMVLGWLASILYGLGYLLLKEHRIMSKFWIGVIIVLILLIGFVLISSVLGFFFKVYLV